MQEMGPSSRGVGEPGDGAKRTHGQSRSSWRQWWIWVGGLSIAAFIAVSTAQAASRGDPEIPGGNSQIASGALPSSSAAQQKAPAAAPSSSHASTEPKTSRAPAAKPIAPVTKPAPTTDLKAEPLPSFPPVPKSWPKTSNARSAQASESEPVKKFITGAQGISPGRQVPEKAIKVPDYSKIASGIAELELESQFAEYASNGWSQTGKVQVVGEPRVQDLNVKGAKSIRVFVCLDSSAIKVTEPDGHIVTDATPPGTRTAVNIYDLSLKAQSWVVVNHQFPNDSSC